MWQCHILIKIYLNLFGIKWLTWYYVFNKSNQRFEYFLYQLLVLANRLSSIKNCAPQTETQTSEGGESCKHRIILLSYELVKWLEFHEQCHHISIKTDNCEHEDWKGKFEQKDQLQISVSLLEWKQPQLTFESVCYNLQGKQADIHICILCSAGYVLTLDGVFWMKKK